MARPDYAEIVETLERKLGDLSRPESRRRLAEKIAELEFELRDMKDFQRTLLAALRARDVVLRECAGQTIAPPSRYLELSPRDALTVQGGLHRLEWDSAIAYRWTGPDDEAAIRVWLDRTIPIVFEVALHSYGDPRNRGSLELRVDGSPIAFHEVGDKLLRSDPFPVLAGSLYTEVAVRTPWMSAGSDEGGARGFSFTHLRFLSQS